MKEDYPAFKKWLTIQDWILDKCEKYPKSTRFTIGQKIINLSLEVTELLIITIYEKEKQEHLKKINLSLEILRVFFRISFDRKYLAINSYEYISKELNEFGSMIGGWLKKV